MSKHGKGSQYERSICRLLSKWLEPGNENPVDHFWRSAGSGAMARVRHRKGKANTDYGDISALTPEARPLLQLFMLELKTGYGDWSFQDLLDGPNPLLPGHYKAAKFIEQTLSSWKESGRPYFAIIFRRKCRASCIAFCSSFWIDLQLKLSYGQKPDLPRHIFFKDPKLVGPRWLVFRLEDFLSRVSPDLVLLMTKELET